MPAGNIRSENALTHNTKGTDIHHALLSGYQAVRERVILPLLRTYGTFHLLYDKEKISEPALRVVLK